MLRLVDWPSDHHVIGCRDKWGKSRHGEPSSRQSAESAIISAQASHVGGMTRGDRFQRSKTGTENEAH